jgi:hypothetical protein
VHAPSTSPTRYSHPKTPNPKYRLIIPGLLVAAPAVIFYTILVRRAVNLPYFDDYYAVLDFLNHEVLLRSAPAKALFFLTSQTGEFRLWLLHAVSWVLLRLVGHVDLRVLEALGDGFVLLLALLLWKMFPTSNENDLPTRVALFIPASWLLFQLQYWETLDWPTSGLQHVPVLVFALGAIYLLTRSEPWAFQTSIAALILAIASDGNGFLVIPIGLLILISNRLYRRATIWFSASAGCAIAYLYRYNLVLSQRDSHGGVFMMQHAEVHHSYLSALLRLSPVYALSFVGGVLPFKAGSVVLGIMLCALFLYLALKGFARRNPAVSYCVLFLLLTSAGVSCLRSDYGLSQSLSSRYAIYSALFMIFAWFAIVEEFIQLRGRALQHDGIFLSAVASSILFALCMDFVGVYGLDRRDSALEKAMAEFEHPTAGSVTPSPAPLALTPGPQGKTSAFNSEARSIVNQSMELGIFQPPSISRVR